MPHQYKTELTFTVTVDHLAGSPPNKCIQTLKDLLTRYPAFRDLIVVSGKTNYRLNAAPTPELKEFDINNPFTLESSPK